MRKKILANTSDSYEKRLLNVVEEMALAANMPVPAIYVMHNELGINAFSAGFTSQDAIIAVTAGALKNFNRAQLQGVIGHEFSHILNGDMQLNIRIIAVLQGIIFISQMGYIFLRSSFRSKSSFRSRRTVSNRGASGLLLGLGLIMIGSVGALLGNLIKAIINRQREYLADSSAVQFTRNPAGIADALKIIGGNHYGCLI